LNLQLESQKKLLEEKDQENYHLGKKLSQSLQEKDQLMLDSQLMDQDLTTWRQNMVVREDGSEMDGKEVSGGTNPGSKGISAPSSVPLSASAKKNAKKRAKKIHKTQNANSSPQNISDLPVTQSTESCEDRNDSDLQHEMTLKLLQEIQARNSTLITESSELNSALKAQQEEIRAEKEKMAILQSLAFERDAQVDFLSQQKVILENELSIVEKESTRSRESILEMNQRLADKENEIIETRSRLLATEKLSMEYLSQIAAQEEDIFKYSTRIKILENQLTIELNNEQSVVDMEINKWDEISQKYQAAYEEWERIREDYRLKEEDYLQQIEELRRQQFEWNEMLKEEVSQRATLLFEFQQTKKHQQETLESLELRYATELATVNGTVNDLIFQRDDLQNHLQNLETTFASERGAFNEQVESFERENRKILEEAEFRISEAHSQISQLTEELRRQQNSQNGLPSEDCQQDIETRFEVEMQHPILTAPPYAQQPEISERNLLERELESDRIQLVDQVTFLTTELQRLREYVISLEEGQRTVNNPEMLENYQAETQQLLSEIEDLRENLLRLEEEKKQSQEREFQMEQMFTCLEREFETRFETMKCDLESTIKAIEEDRQNLERLHEERWSMREITYLRECQQLQDSCESWRQKFSESDQQLFSERKVSEDLKCQLKSEQETKKSIETKLKKFAVELKTKHTSLLESKAETEKLRREIDQLSSTIEKLERDLNQKEDIQKELEEKQLQELRERDEKYEILLRTHKELESTGAQLKKKNESEKQKSNQLQIEIERISSDLLIIQKQFEDERQIKLGLENQINEENEIKKTTEVKLKKYAMELKTRGGTIKEQGEEINHLKELVKVLETRAEELEKKRKLEFDELSHQLRESQQTSEANSQLHIQFQTVRRELEVTLTEKGRLTDQVEELTQQLHELNEFKKTNEIKLKKYALELKSRQEIIKDLKVAETQWVEEKGDLLLELKKLEKLNQDLMANDEMETQFHSLREENSRLQRLLGEFEKAKSVDREREKGIQDQLNSSQTELVNQLNEEKEARKIAEVKVKKYALELRGKLTAVKELKEEIEQMKSQTEQAKIENEKLQANLRLSVENLKENENSHANEIRERDANYDTLLRELEARLQRENEETRREMREEKLRLVNEFEAERSKHLESLSFEISKKDDVITELQGHLGIFPFFLLFINSQNRFKVSIKELNLSSNNNLKRLSH
jgi:hypothetical protein